jgi:MFS superfamily sulfate permease-like transporter
VAVAVITASRSRWRWLAAGYPVLTMLVVVVTANHFWLDGIVSGLLVALALAVQRLIRTARRRGPDRDPGAGDLTDPVHGQLPVGS